ncbi:hypothetical protein [Mucilaginibacter rubeus]|uniref:VOC domain-containing protein n=1 Tax=Mucilaginibacter rubeus TaxID=2027860 RepID=A0A5C1I1J3_9SPHI|nr:hypothetical protein [Mucilaginibacter rubeus]QEM11714.1 hypothetical protein DEO27_017330 [Mucilaginibacter rubeus]
MRSSQVQKKIAINTRNGNERFFNVLVNHLLNAKEILAEPGLQVRQLSDGTVMEFYRTGAHHPGFLFEYNSVVLSFKVTDLTEAVHRLQNTGSQLINRIERLSKDFAYCHFELEDGTIVGLYEES